MCICHHYIMFVVYYTLLHVWWIGVVQDMAYSWNCCFVTQFIIYKLKPDWLSIFTGDNPAVDFETKLYTESMAILEHHIKPIRSVPGVVLEQGYLNKMSEGIKPLFALASQTKAKGKTYSLLLITEHEESEIHYRKSKSKWILHL